MMDYEKPSFYMLCSLDCTFMVSLLLDYYLVLESHEMDLPSKIVCGA